MTLSTSLAVKRYAGDGVTTVFPTVFKFLQNSHVQVIHRAVDGAETPWQENTHYVLDGAGAESGGSLTVLTTPGDNTPTLGETLVLQRIVPLTQETDYPEGGAFPAATHEGALDLSAMRDQQINEDVLRALRVPVSDADAAVTEIPSSIQRANKYLAFDAAAKPIAADPASASGTSVQPTSGTVARLLADWFDDTFNVLAYGADPTGDTDSLAAIVAAIAAAQAAGGGVVFFPAGSYMVSGPIPIAGTTGADTLRLVGQGNRNTIIRSPGTGVSFDSLLLLEGSAYGTTTVAAGAVTAGNLAWGGHYAAQPTITITDTGGGGAGATADAVWDSETGRVTGITITNGGAGYAAATTRLEFSAPEATHRALQISVEHLAFTTIGDEVSCVHIPPTSDQHKFLHCRFVGDGAVSLFKTFSNFLYFTGNAIAANGFATVALDIMGNSISCHYAHNRFGGPGRGLRIRADYQGGNDDRPQGINFDDNHIFCTGKYSLYATDAIFINFNGCSLTESARTQDAAQVWQVDASGPNYVDETADAADAGGADFLPFPAVEAIGDWCAFGHTDPFEQISVEYAAGTAGTDGTVAWEYWDGLAWQALTYNGNPLTASNGDTTAGFTAATADDRVVFWDIPDDWAPQIINGSATLYYVRARVTATYTINPVLDEAHIHEGKERVLLGSGANQIAFNAGTYIGGDTPVRGVTIKPDAGNVHVFNGAEFNYGTTGIVAENDGTSFLNELMVTGCLFQGQIDSALDMDCVRNVVLTGNVDRGTPRNGSWVTRGSHANKGHYSFANNNWHTAGPAVFETGAAYDINGDTGVLGSSFVVQTATGGTTSEAVAHGLFRAPSWANFTLGSTGFSAPWVGTLGTSNVVCHWTTAGDPDIQLQARI